MIKKINNTIVSLQKIINGDIRVIHYDSKGDVTSYLRSISQKYTCTLSPLNTPMEQYDNRMDEDNLRENIEFQISVLIGTQETTYDYNDEFQNPI